MEQAPKIVKARLQVAQPAHSHPDANLLTAFAEQLLNDRERESVASHLSACADCREIVFLATPAAGQDVEVAVPARKSSWLSVPMLKWGTAGALAVIVGAAAMLLKSGPQSHHRTEADYAPIAATPPATRQEPSPAPQAATPPMELSKHEVNSALQPSKDAGAKSMQLRMLPTTPPARTNLDNLPLSGKNIDALRRDQAVSAPAPLDKKAIGSANEMVATGADQAVKGDAVSAMAENKETAQVSDSETAAFEKAKPAQAKPEAAAGAAAPAPLVAGTLASSKRAARANAQSFFSDVAAWSVSPQGDVQRSIDNGQTWSTVPVAQQTAFRVVTAIGAHVWAGGSRGALYHSSDGGATWSAVTPSAGGAKLTGDITTIAFSDPQNGKVTTSSGENWTTSDAGDTWQKQ